VRQRVQARARARARARVWGGAGARVYTHQNHFKKMNRNMSRLQVKEHFILLVLPRGLTCEFPCETRHAVLWVLDMIHHQYSVTELGLQRTARSEYYRRDTVTTTGGHVCGGLLSGPDIGAVYSERRNLSWSSGEIRKRSSQACCRQLEDRAIPRVLLGGFPVSCLNPSQSSFSPPQGSMRNHAIWQVEVSHDIQPHKNAAPPVRPIPTHILRPQNPPFPRIELIRPPYPPASELRSSRRYESTERRTSRRSPRRPSNSMVRTPPMPI